MATTSTLRNHIFLPTVLMFGVFFCVSCNSEHAEDITSLGAEDTEGITLNDKGYFESRGFNLLAFDNAYTGMFFDEKTAGIILIHHGVRTATGGAVRLKPTPEQWDQIPMMVDRTVNEDDNSVEMLLRYSDFDFDSRVRVESQGESVKISVHLDKALPEKLQGRTGFSLEFLPATYFGKAYTADGKSGIFPLHPSSEMNVLPQETQLGQFAGHSTYDDRGRDEYVEPKPIAEGKTFVLAPEDPTCRVKIQSTGGGDLRLLDGRNVAQNGWFVVRTLIPSDKTGKVIEWLLTPTLVPDWTREPMIGYSQVGYVPKQEKVAVIELDQNDTPEKSASLLKLDDQGTWSKALEADLEDWGLFYRYRYVRFDFSTVQESGLYRIQYGNQRSGVFPIETTVYDEIWQPTLDVWFPVQMDHMFVNEGYRVWHGAAHMDDARQAPVNWQHFDGYEQGPDTETKYKPGERIEGLNIGGWFDAGDYDIRLSSHCGTVRDLVDVWEAFELKRDQTLVDQDQHYVDIHHPDGKPDILQQIEHGTLALIAQHRAFGRAIPGIIVPYLHQYHHLGDGSTMTDNLPYDPSLEMYETKGGASGTPDDRWAFTGYKSGDNYTSIAALAAASRALRGYNDALAEECIETAKKAFADEQKRPPQARDNRFGGFFRRNHKAQAMLQLFIATKDSQYGDAFAQEVLSPTRERGMGVMRMRHNNLELAVRAIPYMDAEYKEKLTARVKRYKETNEQHLSANPYGVPITDRGWAGNSAVINWAVTNYLLHQHFPEIIGPEYTYRGLSYIFGCHPYSNVSFVSGVGLQSKNVAYGSNRADFSFIAGGVVPGVLVIKPDFPENKNDWPFLWGENEYVIDICSKYIFLGNAVQDLAKE